jgi:tetratricopeptide (TPR) repeat protein
MVMPVGIREEGKMSKNLVVIFIMSAFMTMIAAPAFCAEEPFDTAAAIKHVEQGVAFIKAKKYDAAIREFEEAAEINPDAESYYYLGYIYYLKGRSGNEESRIKSRENFDKAYEIDPNYSPTRYKPGEPVQPAELMQQEEPAVSQPGNPQQPSPEPEQQKP